MTSRSSSNQDNTEQQIIENLIGLNKSLGVIANCLALVSLRMYKDDIWKDKFKTQAEAIVFLHDLGLDKKSICTILGAPQSSVDSEISRARGNKRRKKDSS